ncbi:Ras- protein Rab6 [Bulinus truncatus]|nr:Ras- protein Rab6 [Bulinus truncatus]
MPLNLKAKRVREKNTLANVTMESGSNFAIQKVVETAVYDIKVSMLGDSDVGKTSIASSFNSRAQANPKATICCELTIKSILYSNGDRVRYTIYDTAGQEKFYGVMANYVRNMDAVIIVYDVTNRVSFTNVDRWLYFVNNHLPYDVPVVLVGNKIDRLDDREVTKQEGKEKAERNNLFFIETSAASGERVSAVFEHISTVLREKKIKELFCGARVPLSDRAIRLSPSTLNDGKNTDHRSSTCCAAS